MSKMLKFLPLVLLSFVFVGCTSTITNLTPSKLPRSATGMYPVEAAWSTRERAVRPASIQPYVQVEFQSYPMRPTLGMKNRWETVVPVPSGQSSINYQIRVDYEYNAFGKPQRSSKLSPAYRLEIMEK